VGQAMRLIRRDATPFTSKKKLFLLRWFEQLLPRIFARLAVTVYRLKGDRRGWRPQITRTGAHLAVVVVTIMAIGLSNVKWPAQAATTLSLPVIPASAGDRGEGGGADVTLTLAGPGEQKDVVSLAGGSRADGEAIARLAQPHTTIPDRPRLGVVTYTVQAGDTVQSIAAAFGLQPTTLMWSNPAVEDAPDLLRIGQEILILPVDGVYHTVAEGETLESIAETYKAEPDAIATCEYNHLKPPHYLIKLGMQLIVPGGEKPYVPKVVTTYEGPVPEGVQGSGQFQWPVLGTITQGYWYGHRAIDIGAPLGSALLAADAGYVSFAGWTDVGYGYLVVIDHGNGFTTYYAHMSNIYVSEGQAVERGQVIGAVGSTGRSTGPHLHFEIRYHGVPQNPRAYLP